MRDYLTPLLQLQRFFVPALVVVVIWAVWRTVVRKDLATGLALYLGLVVVVDGFYNTGIFLPGFEKGSIRFSEVCAAILLLHRPPAPQATSTRRLLLALVIGYFVLMFIAVLRSDPVSVGAFEFRRVMVPQMLAFLVASRGLGTTADHRRFVLGLCAIVLVIGIFDFWDIFFDRWVLHSEMLDKPEYFHNRKQNRFGSIFLNPNFLGAFTVLTFPSLFIWALRERRLAPRLLLWAALLATLFCLIESQSRAPILAFGATLALLVFWPQPALSKTRRIVGLVLFGSLFALFMPGFYDHAAKRFDSLENETTVEVRSRESTWQYTWDIIVDHPVGGIGFGEREFIDAMAKTDFEDRYGATAFDNPHNSYLQAAVYGGFPALAALLLFNLVLLSRAALVSARRTTADVAPAIMGLAVGISGFLASSYPDMHLFTPNVAPIYWAFAGLLFALVTASPAAAPEPGDAKASRTGERSARASTASPVPGNEGL